MIIVSGASGFIGFYLVNQLFNEGYKVIAVDRGGTDEAAYFKKRGIEFIAVDITKSEEFIKLPYEGVEMFINLACIQPANMPDELYDPAKYVQVNILGVVTATKSKGYCILFHIAMCRAFGKKAKR